MAISALNMGYEDVMGAGAPKRPQLQVPPRSYPNGAGMSMRQAGRQSDADAQMRENEFREARRSALLSQIPREDGANSIDPRVRASFRQSASPTAASVNPAMRGGSADRQSGAMSSAIRGTGLTGRTVSQTSAQGISRIDGGSSPLFTNIDPASAVDQMRGGTVSTISGPSVQEMLERAERMRVLREGNQALRDQINHARGGGASFRQLGQDEIVKNMLTSNSRTDRTNAMQLLSGRETRAGALETAKLQGQNNLEVERLRQQTEAPYRQAQTALAQAQTRAAEQAMGPQLRQRPGISREEATLLQGSPDGGAAALQSLAIQQSRYDEARDALAPLLARGVPLEELLADPDTAQYAAELFEFKRPVQKLAEGGLVSVYGQTPQAPMVLPEINEYREYAMGAQRLGLPAVPFEQFLTLRRGAQNVAGAQGTQPYGAMGFASGGEIPDVSGKMVVDTDPNAPTDSIPAVIDGVQPAKLDSGEFVLPADVVKFFGTDKLNKMIAAARQGRQAQE